ncbi:sec1 family domain-containing protein 1-like [Oppia nitens]|uniref:sec1 family domain-containing protein 1-like n=1 Tax=Oppia nitens TaxID=1686743 RepID=UPI0023DCA0FB|nr:sec1 family domain-containing protein 1-like [Oppia nitens]
MSTNFTVRERQKNAMRSILSLNSMVTKQTSTEPVWKVFIYDRCGQDIVSPLFSVKELRESGITLHMQLHSDRDPIPDVPAVYFLLPTDENIMRICQDFRNHLYDHYYLNFISPISRQKLEELASAALQANCANCVTKVYDQYLNFISLEEDMFVLKQQDKDLVSYYAINRSDVKDTDMEFVIDNIVDSLFSVFVTIGVVPIIRSPKGNAAEMVAEKLDRKIRENLRDSRNNLFTGGDLFGTNVALTFQRPLLVILDRNMDMTTPLHHTWTYQALAHDVLDLKLNQVRIDESADPNAKQRKSTVKTYDLNPNDKFWETNKGNPFPHVAEAVQEELEAYRSSEEEVKRLKSEMGLDGNIADEAISLLSDNTAKLTSAVSSLPELLEKKRLIDLHTTIATAILDHIKSRKLDIYFEIEEKIMSKAVLDKSPLELIIDPNAGHRSDKMRLFLIQYLCGLGAVSESEINQILSELSVIGCDLNPYHYIKRWKKFSKLALSDSQYVFHTGGGTKTVSMFSKLMSQGSQFVMEGVKNLVVKKHTLPITRIVDALMEMKSVPEADDYRYFDPKMLKTVDNNNSRNKTPFHDAIVFMVGGGNYIEYQNLVDYCKNKSKSAPKRIIYGTTDLMNANQFLSQLSKLGQEINN